MDILQQRLLSDDSLLCDLSPAPFSPWYLLRDSFAYQRGQVNRIEAQNPLGGSIVLRERRENDTVGATWVVVGTSQDNCWQNAKTLIDAFEYVSGDPTGFGQPDSVIVWRPEGVAAPHEQRFVQVGSADWQMNYSWIALTGGLALQLPATFRVKPASW